MSNQTLIRDHALAGEIRTLFDRAKMPSSPALAVRILELAKDPSSQVADFEEVIRTDSALTARLLKLANSAQYAQRSPATTIACSVTKLGLRRVKAVALGFQLVEHINQLGGTAFDMQAFWQHSLLRACLAQALAETVVPGLAQEAYLVGLLLDCGVPLLTQVFGRGYASLCQSAKLSPMAFHAAEKESFPHNHVEAISVLASEWRLPGEIAVPLAQHHQQPPASESDAPVEQLSAIGYLAGNLRFARDQALHSADHALRDFGSAAFGVQPATWERVTSRAHDLYRGLAPFYGALVPRDVDVIELLSEANRCLTAIVDETAADDVAMAAERARVLRQNQRLARALRDYRERAALDPLTNLLNRGGLIDGARRIIEMNQNNQTPFAILFADLDDFKRVNDTYGHSVGDVVLKSVAACLRAQACSQGVVGRYGGEEFILVLPGVFPEATRDTAERILSAVRALDLSAMGCIQRITCSIGAAWFDRAQVDSVETAFEAADRLMYEAKNNGKDRCCLGVPTEIRSMPNGQSRESRRASSCTPTSEAEGAEQREVELFDRLHTLAQRLNAEEQGSVVGVRKEKRPAWVSPCILRRRAPDGDLQYAEPACLRNLSSGGAAILFKGLATRGEAVQVELHVAGKEHVFHGLMAHCRHLEDGIHEVGIQFTVPRPQIAELNTET